MIYKFKVNNKINNIIENSEDKDKFIEVLTFVFKEIENRGLHFEQHNWESLVNHIGAMIWRSKMNENIEGIEESMFEEVGVDSLELSLKVVDMIGGLKESEKYLLSIHFEAVK